MNMNKIIGIVATGSIFFISITDADAQWTYQRPFHHNSIWNQPIPSGVKLHASSAAMIQKLAQVNGTYTTIAGPDEGWGVTINIVDGTVPKVRVCGVDDNGGGSYYCEDQVPVPSNVKVPNDTDGKTVVIDTSANPIRAWNFYQLKKSNRGTEAFTVGAYGAFGWLDITQTGDGVVVKGGGQWGGRAAGIAFYAGMLQPEEIKQGVIEHALALSTGCAAIHPTQHIWPARGGDGCGSGTGLIPYGSRIRLDPTVNVDTLPMSKSGKMIAKALQKYGAWIVDTGGSVAVYARQFIASNGGVDKTPWAGLLNSQDLNGLPINKLQILENGVEANFYPKSTGGTGICGDGNIQKPNSAGNNEVCDDNNGNNGDQCSSNCLAACTKPAYWNGSKCVATAPAKDASVDVGVGSDDAGALKPDTSYVKSDGTLGLRDSSSDTKIRRDSDSNAQPNGDATATPNQLGGGCQLSSTNDATEAGGCGVAIFFLMLLIRRFHTTPV